MASERKIVLGNFAKKAAAPDVKVVAEPVVPPLPVAVVPEKFPEQIVANHEIRPAHQAEVQPTQSPPQKKRFQLSDLWNEPFTGELTSAEQQAQAPRSEPKTPQSESAVPTGSGSTESPSMIELRRWQAEIRRYAESQ